MTDPTESLKQVLCGLAFRYGIFNLELSTYGVAGLQLLDGTELNFEYVKATEKLFVYAVLATLPEAAADRLILTQMENTVLPGKQVSFTRRPLLSLNFNRL